MSLAVDSFRSDDREALVALKCAVFEGTILENERRRFAWEFDDNPAAARGLPPALVVRDGGDLVAGFTFVPAAVQVGDRIVSGAAGVDLCVAASHRGRGLGRRVVEPFWAEGLCDFPFSTGVNPASLHLFSSCGATLLGGPDETTLHAWFRDGAPGGGTHGMAPGGAAVGGAQGAAGETASVAAVDDVPDDWDAAWADIAPHHSLVLVRDVAYLRWRYVRFPFARPKLLAARDGDGRTRGLAVVQADAALDRMYLLELLARPGDDATLRGLLAGAVDAAREAGAGTLYHSTRRPEPLPALAAAGFVAVPGDYPTYMGKLNTSGPAVSDWTVSLGDGDQLFNVGEPRPS